MPDPVSWLLIQPGWPVYDRYGDEIGTVEKVVGDPAIDIFDGLMVKTHRSHQVHYLPCEVVASIAVQEVRLSIRGDDVPPIRDLRAG